ncbi:MAG: hypothetical protein ACI97A_004218 [Planctomycetota bacterium]|jgi:hypothetical protein
MLRMLRVFAIFVLVLQTVSAQTKTVVLGPDQDNTLFENLSGTTSAGIDDGMFCGVTNNNSRRRGLIRFDVASAIPAGAKIISASMQLQVTQSSGSALLIQLRPVLADWGEAGSMGTFMGGGGGGLAQPGDATWIHTMTPSAFWASAGGDFAGVSASVVSPNIGGPNIWSSPAMANDVQAWIDTPLQNFGWGIVADEKGGGVARRFATREHFSASIRPKLTISYIPRPGSGEDLVLAGSVNAPLSFDPDFTGMANDGLFLHIESPMGGYDFLPHILAAQLHTTGFPPFTPPFFSELYLDFDVNAPSPIIYLYSAFANSFGIGVLPPGGQTFVFGIPAGLAGMSLMIQGFSSSPSAMTGNFFTATNAMSLTFL